MMLKQIVFLFGCTSICLNAEAQIPNTWTKNEIDINAIRAAVMADGSLWHDESSQTPRCEFPKGSGRHLAYAGSLWVGGKTADDSIRVMSQMFKTNGRTDCFPGPLNNAGSTDNAIVSLWSRVWKAKASVIRDFRLKAQQAATPAALAAATTDSIYNFIKEWPAKGSTTARGAYGQPIMSLATETRDFAPFEDVDGDGKYDWTKGDYPAIKGDAMLWTIYNNAAGPKTQSGSLAIGLELQLSVFGYAHGTKADNILFYEYKLINRGPHTLDSTRVGFWADLDIGYSVNDYAGFDSTKRVGFVYNSVHHDSIGAPVGGGYYTVPVPAAGIAMIAEPGDAPANGIYQPTAAFKLTQTGPGTTLCDVDATNAPEAYYNLQGKNRCGDFAINPFTSHPTAFEYPDNPAASMGWSECTTNNSPGDRRVLVSAQPFSFAGNGTSRTYAFALLAIPAAGVCGSFNFGDLRATVDTARKLYKNPPIPTEATIFQQPALSLYPSPAQDHITVVGIDHSTSIKVFDVTGRNMNLKSTEVGNGYTAEAVDLKRGVYAVLVQMKDGLLTGLFQKD